MGAKLGLNCKLYFRTAGVENPIVPGNWTELENAKDVTLNLEKGEADVTTRKNNGWRATLGTLKDGSVEFEMVWDPDEAGFTAIQQAYFNDQSIGIAVMDGDLSTSGTQGLAADMSVINFSRNEPLEEAVTVSVSLKPTYSATPAYWHKT